MCVNWRTCLCWRDPKSPSVAIGVFALVTSTCQILLQATAFHSSYMHGILKSPSADVVKLYITLVLADSCVIVTSIAMLIGLERAGCYKCGVISWIVWIFVYIIYESAINIYYFYLETNGHVFTDQQEILIAAIVYWVGKEITLFVGWLFVASQLCYGDALAVKNSDSTLHLVDTIPSAHACSLGARDAIGPIYYNGGVAQVQVRDNPRSAVSHFDVVRPTSSCQVYSPNWGRASGGSGGIYGPPRYIL